MYTRCQTLHKKWLKFGILEKVVDDTRDYLVFWFFGKVLHSLCLAVRSGHLQSKICMQNKPNQTKTWVPINWCWQHKTFWSWQGLYVQVKLTRYISFSYLIIAWQFRSSLSLAFPLAGWNTCLIHSQDWTECILLWCFLICCHYLGLVVTKCFFPSFSFPLYFGTQIKLKKFK